MPQKGQAYLLTYFLPIRQSRAIILTVLAERSDYFSIFVLSLIWKSNMINNRLNTLLFFALLVVLTSCGQKSKPANEQLNTSNSYAQGFEIDQSHQDYTKIIVFDPWNDYAVHSIYYLTPKEEVETPTDGLKIKVPVQSLMVNSATYLSFIDLLGESDKIKGVCSTKYIYSPFVLEGVREGRILDLGESFNLDTERLLLLNPDIILTSAYSGDQKEAEKFRKLSQRPVFNLEWQEQTLLGRAEWVKFIAAFFDKLELGNQIFEEIEQNYLAAREIAKGIKTPRPTVLSGQDFRGTWSLPGGKSYAAELFRDAKMSYYYEEEESQGSIPSTIEEALVYFHDADIWVKVQASSLAELAETNDKYRHFKAFKEGRVYNSSKRSNRTGGNDYWETGVARPDLLLKDMIKIAHPEALPNYELTFMEKLH